MRNPTRTAWVLGLIPFAGMCFSVPWWDRVQPWVLGLPFNLFWLMCWIGLTSACLWGAYSIESKRGEPG